MPRLRAPAHTRRIAAAATLTLTTLLATFVAAPTAAQVEGEGEGSEFRTRNVILVTLDGLRWQEVFRGGEDARLADLPGTEADRDAFRQRLANGSAEDRRGLLLPFLWNVVAAEGQLLGNVDRESVAAVTNTQLFSYPGYQELLGGFAAPEIRSNAKRPNPNPNVLEWLDGRPGFEGRVAAFCSWDVFPYILNRDRNGLYVVAGREPLPDESLSERQALLDRLVRDIQPPWDGVRGDALTFWSALEYLRVNRPRVLYIALDETDSYAHDGRYDRYLEAAQRSDGFLATLWDTVQSLPEYAGSTTLIVTTDHGRGDGEESWKQHGARIEGADRIWIAILGPDTPALGELERTETVTQAQIAATVAALLREDYVAAEPRAAGPITSVLRER
jgi:hypothetical protein